MATGENMSVLVVQDGHDQAQDLKSLLENPFSARTETVGSPKEAIQILASDPTCRFDIVVLEHDPSDQNGIRVLEEIKNLDDPPVVVVVSGEAGIETAKRALRHGVIGFVEKKDSLADGLRSALASAFEAAERRRYQRSITSMLESLQGALSHSFDLFFLVDPDGRLLLWNENANKLLGYTDDDLKGSSIEDLGEGVDFEAATRGMAAALGGEEVSGYEIDIKSKDKTRIPFEFTGAAINDRNGRPVALIGMGRDISARRLAEETLTIQHKLAMEALRATSVEELLPICLDAVMNVSGMDSGGIYLVDEMTGNLLLAFSSGLSEGFVSLVSHMNSTYPEIAIPMEGKTTYTRTGVFESAVQDGLTREGIKALAIVPIVHEGRLIACVNVASHTHEEVPQSKRGQLEAVAANVGLAIGHQLMQGALRSSEDFFQKAFETAPVMMLLMSPEAGGRFIDVNQALVDSTGYEQGEIVGRTVEELSFVVMPDSREQLFAQARKGNTFSNLEIAYHTKSGQRRQALLSSVPIVVAGRSCLLVSALDITERTRAEEVLRRSETEFRALFENSLDVIAVIAVDGTLDFVTPSVEKVLGYKSQVLLGNNVMDYVHPEDLPVVMETHLSALSTPDDASVLEYRMRRSDGSWVYVESFGKALFQGSKVTGTLVNTRDITERKRIEEAERAKAARAEIMARVSSELADAGLDYVKTLGGVTRSAAELIGDLCVMRLLTEDGRNLEAVAIEHHDPEARRFAHDAAFGSMSRVGEGLAGTVFSTCGARLIDRFDSSKAMNQNHELIEYARRQGVFSIICVPLVVQGIVIGTLGLSRDIPDLPYTEDDLALVEDIAARAAAAIEMSRLHARVQGELAIREQREEELRAANLELQGFAHTVSHDLKGPMSTIKLSLEMLKERNDAMSEEDKNEILEALIRNVGKSYTMVEDLLALAESGQKPVSADHIDVREVVDRLIEDLSFELHGKAITIDIKGDLGSIYANRTHVFQIFSNILRNAVRHSTVDSPKIEIFRLQAESTSLHRYVVRDNGPGIPDEIIDRIFEPFVKGAGGGTGIGLAIVANVVGAYGGAIKAYNENGACFEFVLNDYVIL